MSLPVTSVDCCGASAFWMRELLAFQMSGKRRARTAWAGVSTAELIALYPRLTDRELKEQLIWVLSQKRDSDAITRLIEIAKKDPDREARKKAIFWLGQSNDPRVKDFLLEIINGPR